MGILFALAPIMTKAMRHFGMVLLVACGCTRPVNVGNGTLPSSDPPAPWSNASISAPAIYAASWRAADNRATCRLIAPQSLGDGAGATARAATFSGGWAVAYDKGGMRSAFGVAGTGAKASDSTYRDWPHTRRWADGSTAGYGPEGGGAGPNQLAYLRIAGQGCLYNVWSRLGITHLEYLLDQLRFVETS
jgi:hypothetical protein